MRRMLLSALAAGLVSLTSLIPTADAQVRFRYDRSSGYGYDWHHDQHDHGNRFDQRREDERYHRDLDRRERTRDFIEREAHRLPLTGWQDRLLHRWLDSERREDAIEHDRYHHEQEHHQHYGPYRNGYQTQPQYQYRGYRR